MDNVQSVDKFLLAPYIKVLDYIDQSVSIDERGDLLIFMSGINEVRINFKLKRIKHLVFISYAFQDIKSS